MRNRLTFNDGLNALSEAIDAQHADGKVTSELYGVCQLLLVAAAKQIPDEWEVVGEHDDSEYNEDGSLMEDEGPAECEHGIQFGDTCVECDNG